MLLHTKTIPTLLSCSLEAAVHSGTLHLKFHSEMGSHSLHITPSVSSFYLTKRSMGQLPKAMLPIKLRSDSLVDGPYQLSQLIFEVYLFIGGEAVLIHLQTHPELS